MWLTSPISDCGFRIGEGILRQAQDGGVGLRMAVLGGLGALNLQLSTSMANALSLNLQLSTSMANALSYT
jgi:hypothetical protein